MLHQRVAAVDNLSIKILFSHILLLNPIFYKNKYVRTKNIKIWYFSKMINLVLIWYIKISQSESIYMVWNYQKVYIN